LIMRRVGHCVPGELRGGRTSPSLFDDTGLVHRSQHAILGLVPGDRLAVLLKVVGRVALALLVRDDLALELVGAGAGAARGGAALWNALCPGQLAELRGDQHGGVVDDVLVPEDVLPPVGVGKQLEAEGLDQRVAGEEATKALSLAAMGFGGPARKS
jgi:hypothetical protein